jgi:myo-inositol-1(or 4)-monophosphatase
MRALHALAEYPMHPMLNIAVRASRAAGDIIVRYMNRIDSLTVTEKSLNDFVSEVDREAERVIIEVLRKAYPSHAFLGEESGAHAGDAFEWVIDPLDGTTNYVRGFPQFAVSIALRHAGTLEQAVVFDPIRQELFTASRGSGAQLDGRRIRVSRRGLKGALLGTGFPFRQLEELDVYMDTMKAFVPRSAGIRRAGAAALDLAYVAAGRLDGFWELGLAPWDMAAGILLIREAGGIVTDLGGDEDFMRSGNVVAGNPRTHGAMLEVLRPFATRVSKG